MDNPEIVENYYSICATIFAYPLTQLISFISRIYGSSGSFKLSNVLEQGEGKMEKLEIKVKDAKPAISKKPYDPIVNINTAGIVEISDRTYNGGTSIRYWM